MSLSDWFEAKKKKTTETVAKKKDIGEGLWTKCEACKETQYSKDLRENLFVCPKCGYHMRISARDRIEIIFDPETFQEFNADLTSADPLNFVDTQTYKDRLKSAIAKTAMKNAIVTGAGRVDGETLVAAVMEFNFMGGSMGSVVGEKIALAAEKALELKAPLIIVSASGGARMQEGILSLMQMAKTSAALAKLRENRLLYISLLTDPTTGGVTASFAMLGDVNLSEPGAMIGFAGRRVIEQTIRQKLPKDFQTAEYLVTHGMVDVVVPRSQLKSTLSRLIKFHKALS